MAKFKGLLQNSQPSKMMMKTKKKKRSSYLLACTKMIKMKRLLGCNKMKKKKKRSSSLLACNKMIRKKKPRSSSSSSLFACSSKMMITKKMGSESTTSRAPLDLQIPQDVLMKIFVLLPAKSLMRFRCVCKFWKTLMSDPYLAKLHYKHAKTTRPEASHLLFYLRTHALSARSIFPTNLDGVLSSQLPTFNFHEALPCTNIVNGLICLYGRRDYKLSLLNLTTGEKLTLPVTKFLSLPQQFSKPSFFLICRKRKYKVLFIGNDCCEIFTLGKDHSWRDIERPPHMTIKGTICCNGAIYWKDKLSVDDCRMVQFFDFKTEKFELLKPPREVDRSCQLAQIANYIGFVCRKSYRPQMFNLWTFNCEDKKWIRDVINLGFMPITNLEVIGHTRKSSSEILMTAKSRCNGALRLIFYDLETRTCRAPTQISVPGMPKGAANHMLLMWSVLL